MQATHDPDLCGSVRDTAIYLPNPEETIVVPKQKSKDFLFSIVMFFPYSMMNTLVGKHD